MVYGDEAYVMRKSLERRKNVIERRSREENEIDRDRETTDKIRG